MPTCAGADEIEVAVGIEALFALGDLGLAEPAPASFEQVAGAVAVAAKVPGGLGVVDERRRGEMRIGGAEMIDQRPERSRVARAEVPAGEEGAAIGEGERGAEVEADERIRRHVVVQPIEHVGAATRRGRGAPAPAPRGRARRSRRRCRAGAGRPRPTSRSRRNGGNASLLLARLHRFPGGGPVARTLDHCADALGSGLS